MSKEGTMRQLDDQQSDQKSKPRELTDKELSQVAGGMDTWDACGAGAIAASWTGPLGSVTGCAAGGASYEIGSALGVVD